MSKLERRVVKAALEWEHARRKCEEEPTDGRRIELNYADIDLLQAIKDLREAK